MNAAKLSQQLRAYLEPSGSEGMITIILELERSPDMVPPNLSQSERIASLRGQFDRKASTVGDAVSRLGGEVLERAWINHTLYARVPKESLGPLSELADIRQVDISHRLHRD